MSVVKFSGCEHLDFEKKYLAKMQLLSGNRVFWMREAPYEGAPTMVQFCKKRGRLNNPEACLEESHAYCDDYNEVEHTVDSDW